MRRGEERVGAGSVGRAVCESYSVPGQDATAGPAAVTVWVDTQRLGP